MLFEATKSAVICDINLISLRMNVISPSDKGVAGRCGHSCILLLFLPEHACPVHYSCYTAKLFHMNPYLSGHQPQRRLSGQAMMHPLYAWWLQSRSLGLQKMCKILLKYFPSF